MAQISFVARSFITERLLDPRSGFNYWITQAASDYGIESFQLVRGDNFFTGNLTAPQIDANGEGNYPMCFVATQRATNTPPLTTPSEWSGVITSNVDFWSGFVVSEPPDDPEAVHDAIEDAITETFNRQDYYGLTTGGLTYNNELSFQRGPLVLQGQNWVQQMRCTLIHRFYTMGR